MNSKKVMVFVRSNYRDLVGHVFCNVRPDGSFWITKRVYKTLADKLCYSGYDFLRLKDRDSQIQIDVYDDNGNLCSVVQ